MSHYTVYNDLGKSIDVEDTGYSLQVDLGRLALYIAMIALTVFGELPWWGPVLVALYDIRYFKTFHSPKRKQALQQLRAEQQRYWGTQLTQDNYKMPGVGQ